MRAWVWVCEAFELPTQLTIQISWQWQYMVYCFPNTFVSFPALRHTHPSHFIPTPALPNFLFAFLLIQRLVPSVRASSAARPLCCQPVAKVFVDKTVETLISGAYLVTNKHVETFLISPRTRWKEGNWKATTFFLAHREQYALALYNISFCFVFIDVSWVNCVQHAKHFPILIDFFSLLCVQQ